MTDIYTQLYNQITKRSFLVIYIFACMQGDKREEMYN